MASTILERVSAQTLADGAAAQIYGAILDGRFKPGERLSEASLAREMGLSRGPVREAQRLLEKKGLLAYHTRQGFFVRALDRGSVADLFDVRSVLEHRAIDLAITRATDDDLRELVSWCDHTHNGRAPGDRSRIDLVEEDLRLHETIFRLSKNRTLIAASEIILSDMRLMLAIASRAFCDLSHVGEWHAALIDALIARNAPLAHAELARHLEFGQLDTLDRLDELGPNEGTSDISGENRRAVR